MKKQTAMWCILLVIITVCQAIFIRMLSWQNKDTLMANQTVDTMEVVTGTNQTDLNKENIYNQETQEQENGELSYEHSGTFIVLKIAEGIVLLVIVGGIIAQAIYIIPRKKEEENVFSKENNLLQQAKVLEDYLNNNGVIKFDHSDMMQTIITSLQFSDDKQIEKEDYNEIVRLLMTYYTEYNVKNSVEVDESKLSELDKLKRIEYMSFMTYVDISKNSDKESIKGLVLGFLKQVKDLDELNEFKALGFKDAVDKMKQLEGQSKGQLDEQSNFEIKDTVEEVKAETEVEKPVDNETEVEKPVDGEKIQEGEKD